MGNVDTGMVGDVAAAGTVVEVAVATAAVEGVARIGEDRDMDALGWGTIAIASPVSDTGLGVGTVTVTVTVGIGAPNGAPAGIVEEIGTDTGVVTEAGTAFVIDVRVSGWCCGMLLRVFDGWAVPPLMSLPVLFSFLPC